MLIDENGFRRLADKLNSWPFDNDITGESSWAGKWPMSTCYRLFDTRFAWYLLLAREVDCISYLIDLYSQP